MNTFYKPSLRWKILFEGISIKTMAIFGSIILMFIMILAVIAAPASAAKPCTVTVTAPASIQDAVDASSPGDVICLDGTFSQSVVIGPEDSGITLRSASTAVLSGIGSADAGTIIDPDAGIKLLDGVVDIEIISLELTGYSGSRGSGISAWDVSTSNIRVQDNYIHGNNWNGILVGSEGGFIHDHWRVENNEVTDNGFVGIELTNCEHCVINENDIHDNGFADVVIQARNTVPGSGAVNINDVKITNNDIGSSSFGIYILSITSNPTTFAPIAGASTLLKNVVVRDNNIKDSTVAQIRFWAFNDAARAEPGLILKNEINCPTDVAGIQILQRGLSGQNGDVENVKVKKNTIDNDCKAITDEQ